MNSKNTQPKLSPSQEDNRILKSNPGQSGNAPNFYSEVQHAELTHKVIGCAMEVHNILGNGFQEVIYQRSLAIEFAKQSIAFTREIEMPLYYKDFSVGSRRVDFFIDEKVLLEIKAVILLEYVHLAQALNYLEAFNIQTGLLINFGSKSLQFKRLLNKKYKATPST